MPEPLNNKQCEHVLKTIREWSGYLYRLHTALVARGHDRRHLFFRLVDDTWKCTCDITYVAGQCMMVSGTVSSTLHTGTMLPDRCSDEDWRGMGI